MSETPFVPPHGTEPAGNPSVPPADEPLPEPEDE